MAVFVPLLWGGVYVTAKSQEGPPRKPGAGPVRRGGRGGGGYTGLPILTG